MATAAVSSTNGTHELPTYHQVPETKHDRMHTIRHTSPFGTKLTPRKVEWADLATLDLSTFDEPGGKERLADQLYNAIQKVGFFYIINFGLSQEQVDRQFAIGKQVFELPTEEKLKYRADLEHGGYNGYKPLGLREIKPGVFDNTEIFNIPKFIPEYDRPQPEIVREHWDEIEDFAKHIHGEVVRKLLVLSALVLELPEDYFLKHHRYTAKSDCHLRYMKYHARRPEENSKLGDVWVKGHTDFGSMTLLFRQPVAALQVRGADGEWKWVKPYPGSITVNLADSLDFITNSFLKSSIHRVVAPPPDQAGIDRLGVLYFVRPEDDMPLKPVESAVLKKLGLEPEQGAATGYTAGEWVKARVAGGVGKGKVRSEMKEEEILPGVKAKYYD